MEIKQEQEHHRGRFFTENGWAELTYHFRTENIVVIDHTGVDERLEGRGMGSALVEALVQWARAGGKKVWPMCPFAQALFERSRQFDDVLYQA